MNYDDCYSFNEILQINSRHPAFLPRPNRR
jgi:hypothetical protein